MPHNVFGPKLSRDTGQRQALLKGLAGALIRSEAIETTATKAIAAKVLIEKLITRARRGTISDVRAVEELIVDKDLVHKLVHDIAPRFKGRPGGFLRLVKLGNRVGDNAPMVRMEFVSPAAAVVVADTKPEVTETKVVSKKASSSPKAPKTPAKTKTAVASQK